jgi:hypothetical protein
VIDMGPEGGAGGGQVIAQGTPEQVAEVEASYTGHFIKQILRQPAAPITLDVRDAEIPSIEANMCAPDSPDSISDEQFALADEREAAAEVEEATPALAA